MEGERDEREKDPGGTASRPQSFGARPLIKGPQENEFLEEGGGSRSIH